MTGKYRVGFRYFTVQFTHDIHYIHDIFTIVENTSLNMYANLYIFCIILSSLTLDHTVQSIQSTRIKLLTSLDLDIVG